MDDIPVLRELFAAVIKIAKAPGRDEQYHADTCEDGKNDGGDDDTGHPQLLLSEIYVYINISAHTEVLYFQIPKIASV